MHLKMPSVKWRSFCLGLNVLRMAAGIKNVIPYDQITNICIEWSFDQYRGWYEARCHASFLQTSRKVESKQMYNSVKYCNGIIPALASVYISDTSGKGTGIPEYPVRQFRGMVAARGAPLCRRLVSSDGIILYDTLRNCCRHCTIPTSSIIITTNKHTNKVTLTHM